MLPRLLPLALLVLLAAVALGQNDEGFQANPGPPPPEPNPVQIDVPRGQAVWITLSAYSLTSPILRYRIKRQPHAGKLGIPRITTGNTGAVKYQPPDGVGPGDDSFSYQVQSDAGVSASAEVEIKITDKDPVLITPGDIEFGEVLPGQSVTRTLDMQNIGGNVAEGEVQLPDGWTLQGDPSYSLTAGQKKTFTITFAPSKLGSYTGDVVYTGNPERATDLNGAGVPPLSVTSGTLELQQSGAMRAAMIEVKNRTSDPQTLTLTAGPRLDVAQTALVQANGTLEIEVRAKGDAAQFTDQVTVEGAGTKNILPIHAAPVLMDLSAVAATPTPTPAATPAPANPAPAPVEVTPGPIPGISLRIPGSGETFAGMPVCALGVGDSTETTTEVGCDFKGVPLAHSYRVETRSIVVDGEGNPTAQWTPFKDAALTVKGAVVIAEMENLQPGAQYEVRIVGLDAHGNIVDTSGMAGIRTVAAKKPWTWQWAVLATALLAIAAPAWQRWRRREKKPWAPKAA